MTTNSTTTSQKTITRDFESVKELAASPDCVLAALRTPEAVAGWWGPTIGSLTEGGTFSVDFGGPRRIDMVATVVAPGRVEWQVEAAPHTPEWDGTTIVFELAPAGKGTTVRFRHIGLTPQLECFDMCHSGWTHYLASFVAYVEGGEGQPYTED
jgi:uncharacterized protein YndB with AHSA1/START domain